MERLKHDGIRAAGGHESPIRAGRRRPGARWRIVLLTCREAATDFRLPLAEALQALGHEVAYVYLRRRPIVTEMASPERKQEFSLADFLQRARRLLRRPDRPLLVFNSTNLVFPGLCSLLRIVVGGVWCFDMHDELFYGATGMKRRRMRLAQAVLLGGSDLVVHAAPTLAELFPRSRHLGNASAIGFVKRPSTDFSKVLILASLDRRIDFPLVAETAALNPHLTFDIYGHISGNDAGVRADLDRLLADHPNVAYRGAYQNVDLPGIFARYAITLAPYAVGSALTRYIDPLRYYHCLNAGMEVVSTAIPKAFDFAGRIHILGSPDEFGPLVERLRDDPAARLNDYPDVAGNSWRARAERLTEIVSEHAPSGARKS